MSNDTSGPAFPINANESLDRCIYTGMTLRDYFAAEAMQAFSSGGGQGSAIFAEQIAEAAYFMADAMLKIRER